MMPLFRKNQTPETAAITHETAADIHTKMSFVKKMEAEARKMHKETKDTIYKEVLGDFSDSVKKGEKVLSLGCRKYKIGGKTEKALKDFYKSYENSEIASFQMRIKLQPDEAIDTLFEWIKKVEDKDMAEEEKEQEKVEKMALELLENLEEELDKESAGNQ